jgi:hypothetical protein
MEQTQINPQWFKKSNPENGESASLKAVKNIGLVILGITFFVLILAWFACLSIYGTAYLENFTSPFWANLIFVFSSFMFPPVSFILIIIGIFMESTPPAWLGVLALFPGLIFIIPSMGFSFIKNKITRVKVYN